MPNTTEAMTYYKQSIREAIDLIEEHFAYMPDNSDNALDLQDVGEASRRLNELVGYLSARKSRERRHRNV